jgi:hypothetical protein
MDYIMREGVYGTHSERCVRRVPTLRMKHEHRTKKHICCLNVTYLWANIGGRYFRIPLGYHSDVHGWLFGKIQFPVLTFLFSFPRF